MYASRSPRSRSWSHMFNTLTILIVMVTFFAGAAPIRAQEGAEPERGTLDTIVASDGSVPEASTAGVSRGRRFGVSVAHHGTGEVVTGEAATTQDPPVAAVPLPSEGGPETVILPDGRFQTATTTYPHRAIAHVTSSIGGCTGWLIGPNTVVTAGHCIYGNSGWATNVRVYPGRNGNVTPYGSCNARRLYSVTGWTQSNNRDYDYGAIKLDCLVGNSTGWFGYRWQSASLTNQASYLSGYPGDKAYGTQWRHNDQVRLTQTRRLYYANDTFNGQSGAPVWNATATCNPCGIAIHAYGLDATGYNGGTRITEGVFNNLTTWKNAP